MNSTQEIKGIKPIKAMSQRNMSTQQNNNLKEVTKFFGSQGITIAFVLMLAVFGNLSNTFLTRQNIITVLLQVAVTGVIACGVTLVVIGGNFDLSVGSMLSLTTILAIDMHNKLGPVKAIIVVLIMGMAIGAINGLLIGYVRLNSLIVTLAMQYILSAYTLIYTKGTYYSIEDSTTFFAQIAKKQVLGVPIMILLLLGVAVITGIVLTKTLYGRYIFSVGDNAKASQYAGINHRFISFSTFVLTGFLVGLAGIMLASRLMSTQSASGSGIEVDVLAAIVLGGTSLLGGKGSIYKTIIGILILGFLKSGLIMLGSPYYIQWIASGIIIVCAILLDNFTARGGTRR